MPLFKLDDKPFTKIKDKVGKDITVIKKDAFEKFNPSVLGLGDITKKSTATDAIAAVFDLQGFTNFCKQIEPQLSVPLFLTLYLDWIFKTIRKESCEVVYADGVCLWHDLPFLTKFMGDGLLVVWNTQNMDEIQQHNLIVTLHAICSKYKKLFLPMVRKKVCDPPEALRCGVAKGTVYSVGNGNDFVGPCINLAARLQKLDMFTFAFSRRGFNPEEEFAEKVLPEWILKKVSIRGMGDGELIYIRKDEYDKATPETKKKYMDP